MMLRFRYALPLAAALIAFGCGTQRPMAVPDAPPAMAAPMPTPAAPPVAAMPAAPAAGYSADYDTVRAGRFDNGRMFTVDEPPTDYFRETYGFAPDQAWFDRARLGALRFATYCSASFVSDDGLILTNHHCARESVTHAAVEDGNDYNADGFYARTLAQEKPIEDLFVEQLIAIEDITARITGAAANAADPAARVQAIAGAIQAAEQELTAGAGEGHRVQVVTLYSGGQYKAYTYRRYGDIRLVFAPEELAAFFGGDPDNFTYPRYSLDFSLFRAYGEDGRPLETDNFFRFEPAGTDPGDLVFVLGNPGSTTRMQTVAQLEYRRDYTEPAFLALLESGMGVYGDYSAAHPGEEGIPEMRDLYFSLSNSQKAYEGRVGGLRDPYLIARRRAAEQSYIDALAARPDLMAQYGSLIDDIAANRAGAQSLGPAYGAFVGLVPGSPLTATVMGRGILAAQYLAATETEARDRLRGQLGEQDDQPADVQRELLRIRFERFQQYFGMNNAVTAAALSGRNPAASAAALLSGSALDTQAGTETLLGQGDAALAADPAVVLAQAILPALGQFQQGTQAANAQIADLTARLARARFELYGTSIPPDATFTLRISDGVVRGYRYNGTQAPPYTTTYGLYDRATSFCDLGGISEDCPWAMPPRWAAAREEVNMATPFNLVSTNDIIGGNSGSPLLNRDLEVVGIVFDGNIESLPGNFIYDDRFNRTVSVDVRIMLESLETVYDMDRIARELRNGGM